VVRTGRLFNRTIEENVGGLSIVKLVLFIEDERSRKVSAQSKNVILSKI
jgi:hypothetical protein